MFQLIEPYWLGLKVVVLNSGQPWNEWLGPTWIPSGSLASRSCKVMERIVEETKAGGCFGYDVQ